MPGRLRYPSSRRSSASAATMTVEDAPVLSGYSRILHRSLELKKLDVQLEKGVITVLEYEAQKADAVLRYS